MKVTLAVLALIITPLGLPLSLRGQEFLDPLLPVGQLRVEINSLFHFADDRFGRRMEGGSLIEENEPLGFDFADTAVGTRLFPTLEDLEADLTAAPSSTRRCLKPLPVSGNTCYFVMQSTC